MPLTKLYVPQTGCPAGELQVRLGNAKFNRDPGMSKFGRLNRLKISVRNSRFIDSVIGKRLLKIRSNCLKSGPRKAFRGTLPKAPGAGAAKAAGFSRFRSLFKYGLTPETKSGRRTFRDAPPLGVLTTAMNPEGNGFVPLTVPGSWATKPFAKVVVTPAPVGTTQPAEFTHCMTTSGRTMPISSGSPERALKIVP